MIRAKLIEQDEEGRRLYDIISDELGEDIDVESRKQEIAYARVVFAKILLDLGHRPSRIASQINKHRSSIYHYEKVFNNISSHNKFMKDLYDKSLNIFNKTRFDYKDVDYVCREGEIEDLTKEIKELKSLNRTLTVKAKNGENVDVDRFYETFKAITLNVKKGREELLSNKIFNTINTVNSSLVY